MHINQIYGAMVRTFPTGHLPLNPSAARVDYGRSSREEENSEAGKSAAYRVPFVPG